MEKTGQLHAPAALPMGKSPGPLNRRLVGSRAGLGVWEKKISSSGQDMNPVLSNP